MKSLTIVFISVLLASQVLGHYKPTNDEEHSSESDDRSSKQNELRHDNNKYRFNFAVQEPEPTKTEDEDEDALKSFAYKVKSPVTENQSKVSDEEVPEDTVGDDKPGCACSGSCTCSQNPCICQYGNCPLQTDSFFLPVQYESNGDYVEYDYPERNRRQIPNPLAGITGMVAEMSGRISDTVQNIANAFGNQRLEQRPSLFTPASGFSSEQRQDRVAQVTEVGQMSNEISGAVQNTDRVMGSQRQSEQQPGILVQSPTFGSDQSPQPFTRITGSVGDMTGHMAGMVRDTTQQAAQIMNQFTMRRDDSIRQKRSINNVNERDSLNFVESVRRGRQVDSTLRNILQQMQQALPKGSDLLSQMGIGQNSDMRSRAEGLLQDIRGGRLSDIGTRLREMTQSLGSSRDQEVPFEETLQRLGMSKDGPNAALRTQMDQWFQRFRSNDGAQAESRKKRSVYTANEWYESQIPVLQVKERPNETIENFKRLSESRVELHAPDCLRLSTEPPSEPNDYEEPKKCNKCGAHLTGDSMCQSCGAHQSPYFEYVNGEPVSYHPKTTEKRSSESSNPRYVFDRYGHRYLEHNGNLRLMAPESYPDEFVGSTPNYFGLREILDQNRDVMHDLNRNGPRMIPRPSEYIQDTIRYIHELARRDTKRTDSENKKSGDTKKKLKSIYQILPVRYDGKNGEMVMKVYSAKDREDEYRRNNQRTDVAEKSKPSVQKFRKNSKEYEILSFDNNYSKRHD